MRVRAQARRHMSRRAPGVWALRDVPGRRTANALIAPEYRLHSGFYCWYGSLANFQHRSPVQLPSL